MRVKPVREATGSRPTVGGKHVVGPILGQVVHGVRIAAVDDVGFFDDVSLALEKPSVDVVALKVRFHVFPVGTVAVDVNPNQNLIGQGLERPPHEGLEHLSRHVNLSDITGSLCVRIVVVRGHEVLQPRLHHVPAKQMTVKRPAEDNL